MSHREGFTPPVPLPMASGDVIVVTGGHRGKPPVFHDFGSRFNAHVRRHAKIRRHYHGKSGSPCVNPVFYPKNTVPGRRQQAGGLINRNSPGLIPSKQAGGLINRNSPGLIPSNGACYPCAGAMLFLLKMMTTGGPENPSHTPQGGGSRPEASSIETRQG